MMDSWFDMLQCAFFFAVSFSSRFLISGQGFRDIRRHSS